MIVGIKFMNNTKVNKENISKIITEIISKPEKCGFEIYAVTKTKPRLKKIGFVENKRNDLTLKLKSSIFNILSNKYCSEDAIYETVDNIADEQNKFYLIPTSNSYNPFLMLNDAKGSFKKADIDDATGIVFLIKNGNKRLWAYQHLWSIMIPNKSKKNLMARMISNTESEIFEEMSEPLLTFANRIDLLIIDDYIITSNYKLLENSFEFKDYINYKANEVIKNIKFKNIVANIDKLNEYIMRGNGKLKYAKKMMRISNSSVLKMDTNKLWRNIHKSSRWNGKIKEENGKFVLETYAQIEYLIDLLDERYTRSDITGEEYDTEVKQLADPIE